MGALPQPGSRNRAWENAFLPGCAGITFTSWTKASLLWCRVLTFNTGLKRHLSQKQEYWTLNWKYMLPLPLQHAAWSINWKLSERSKYHGSWLPLTLLWLSYYTKLWNLLSLLWALDHMSIIMPIWGKQNQVKYLLSSHWCPMLKASQVNTMHLHPSGRQNSEVSTKVHFNGTTTSFSLGSKTIHTFQDLDGVFLLFS